MADMLCLSSTPSRRISERLAGIFITRCCNRPICPACLHTNPRLGRYHPCLHCLGGVDIMNRDHVSQAKHQPESLNLDGALRHEDVFALGEDDEDDEAEAEDEHVVGHSASLRELSSTSITLGMEDPIRNAQAAISPDMQPPGRSATTAFDDPAEDTSSSLSDRSRYYIKPGDTLRGIALKLKVNERLLCRLNGLPLSTLSTTPHLLHTRSALTLPLSPTVPLTAQRIGGEHSEANAEHEARRAREKAANRFQAVTKEIDWQVANTYVALAELAPNDDSYSKEAGEKKAQVLSNEVPVGVSSLEATAVDCYLDDDEWEQRERREGRGVAIPRFPLFDANANTAGKRPAVGKLWSGWTWAL